MSPTVERSLGGVDEVMRVCYFADTHEPQLFNSLTAIVLYKGSGGNKKLLPCRFPTVGIVRVIRQTTTQLPPTNIITMVFRLPPLQHRFNESPQSDVWAAIQRGWPRAVTLGFL